MNVPTVDSPIGRLVDWATLAERGASLVFSTHTPNSRQQRLTAVQVRAIRADSRHREVVAREYGIGAQQVSRIKSGEAWENVR